MRVKGSSGRDAELTFSAGLPALKYVAMIGAAGTETVVLEVFDTEGRTVGVYSLTIPDVATGLPQIFDNNTEIFDTFGTTNGSGEATPGSWSGAIVLSVTGTVYHNAGGKGILLTGVDSDDVNVLPDTSSRQLAAGDVLGGGAP